MISVVVPVYKSERYLRRCINSILSQTHSNLEIILVDDGSPDSCPAICDEYTKKDDRVHVVHQENQGQAAARNQGVLLARGEWICFVDSDDLIHPRMLELLYAAVASTGALIGMCGTIEGDVIPNDFWNITAEKASMFAVSDETIEVLIESDHCRYWGPCGKLIARSILLEHPFTVGRIYEDSAVTCKWFISAKVIADYRQNLYFYQNNLNSTTKSEFSIKKLDVIWSYEEQLTFFEALGYKKTINVLCRRFLIVLCDYYTMLKKNPQYREATKSIRKEIRAIRKRYRLVIHMTNYEKDRCLHVLYPFATKCIWKFQSLLKKGG